MRHLGVAITALLAAAACTTSVTISRGKSASLPQSPSPTLSVTPSVPASVLDHLGAKRPAVGSDASPQPNMSQPPASQGFGGGGGGGGGGPLPSPGVTSTPMPYPSLVWIRPTILPSLPPSPSATPTPSATPAPTPTPTPVPTPTPRIGPIDPGIWRLTVTVKDDEGPETTWVLHYNLACQADGKIVVDGGAVPQTHDWADGPAWLGWQGNHLKFVDASSDIDGAAWHLFYELTASSPTTVDGSAVLIGPTHTWHFDTIGHRLP